MCNMIMVFLFTKNVFHILIYLADMASYMSNFDNFDIHQISSKLPARNGSACVVEISFGLNLADRAWRLPTITWADWKITYPEALGGLILLFLKALKLKVPSGAH